MYLCSDLCIIFVVYFVYFLYLHIYICTDNVLLKEPLKPEHIKPRLLGHFGTSPGLNMIYVHMNRCLNERPDLNAIFLTGPGHGKCTHPHDHTHTHTHTECDYV